MAKVIVNGEEQEPVQKIKLVQHISPVKINKLVKQKSEEQRNAKQPPEDKG